MKRTFNLLHFPVIFSLAFIFILFSLASDFRPASARRFPLRRSASQRRVAETRAVLANVFVLDPQILLAVKQRVVAGDPELKPAYDDLIKDADRALKAGPFTITNKKDTPPSGDVHDYTSLAPYWWPDPSKPDRLPYIRRDGRVNPERNKFRDRSTQRDMCEAVTNLALAYCLSGNEAYAEHAVELLRVFFLDEKTKMNPNLNYSQAIKGQNTGRGSGIVETAGWIHLIDAFGMLNSSKAWTEQIDQGLQAWFGEFLDWLLTSESGKDESQSDNNHGTQYDAQVCAYALFLGKSELARQVMEQAKVKRIAVQIEPDGRQPSELARTSSWGYSMINLRNLEYMASLASKVGVDLWNYETPDGRSIRRVLQWHVPFAIGEKKWGYKDIRKFEPELMFASLRRAAIAYQEPQYEKWAEALPGVKPTDRDNLLYPKPKF